MLDLALFDKDNEDDERGSMLFGSSVDYYEHLADQKVKFPEKINYFKHALKEMQQQQSSDQDSQSGNKQQRNSKSRNSYNEQIEQVKEEEFEESIDITPDIETSINSFNSLLLHLEMTLTNNENNEPIPLEETKETQKEIEKFRSNSNKFKESISFGTNATMKQRYSFQLDGLISKANSLFEAFNNYNHRSGDYITFRNSILRMLNPDLLAILLDEEEKKNRRNMQAKKQQEEQEAKLKQEQEMVFKKEQEKAAASKKAKVLEIEEIDDPMIWEPPKNVKNLVKPTNFRKRSEVAAIVSQELSGDPSALNDFDPPQQLFYYKDSKSASKKGGFNLNTSEEKKSSARYENQDDVDSVVLRSFNKPEKLDNRSTTHSTEAKAKDSQIKSSINKDSFLRDRGSLINNASEVTSKEASIFYQESFTPTIAMTTTALKSSIRENESKLRFDELNNQLAFANEKLSLCEQEKSLMQMELIVIKKENESFKKDIDRLNSSVMLLETQNGSLLSNLEGIRFEKTLLENRIEEQSNNSNQKIVGDLHALTYENGSMQKEIARLNNEVSKKVAELEMKKLEMSTWILAKEKEKGELVKMKDVQYSELMEKQRVTQEESLKISQQVIELTKEKRAYVDQIEQLKEEINELKNKVEQAMSETIVVEKEEQRQARVIISENEKLQTQIEYLQAEVSRQNEYQVELEGQLQSALTQNEKELSQQKTTKMTVIKRLQEIIVEKQRQIVLLQTSNAQLKEHITVLQNRKEIAHLSIEADVGDKLHSQQSQINHLTSLVTLLQQNSVKHDRAKQQFNENSMFLHSRRASGENRKCESPSRNEQLEQNDELPVLTYESFADLKQADLSSSNQISDDVPPNHKQQHRLEGKEVRGISRGSMMIKTSNLFDENNPRQFQEFSKVFPNSSQSTLRTGGVVHDKQERNKHTLDKSNEEMLNLSDYLRNRTIQLGVPTSSRGGSTLQPRTPSQQQQHDRRSPIAFGRPQSSLAPSRKRDVGYAHLNLLDSSVEEMPRNSERTIYQQVLRNEQQQQFSRQGNNPIRNRSFDRSSMNASTNLNMNGWQSRNSSTINVETTTLSRRGSRQWPGQNVRQQGSILLNSSVNTPARSRSAMGNASSLFDHEAESELFESQNPFKRSIHQGEEFGGAQFIPVEQSGMYPLSRMGDYVENNSLSIMSPYSSEKNDIQGGFIDLNSVNFMRCCESFSNSAAALNRFKVACLQNKGVVLSNQLVKVGSMTTFESSHSKKYVNLTLYFFNVSQFDFKDFTFTLNPIPNIQPSMSPKALVCDLQAEHKIKVNFQFDVRRIPFSLPTGQLKFKHNQISHTITVVLPITILKFAQTKETSSQEFDRLWNSTSKENKSRTPAFEVNSNILSSGSGRSIRNIFPDAVELGNLVRQEHNGPLETDVGVRGTLLNLGELSYLLQNTSIRSSSPNHETAPSQNRFDSIPFLIKFHLKSNKRLEVSLALQFPHCLPLLANSFLDALYFLFKA